LLQLHDGLLLDFFADRIEQLHFPVGFSHNQQSVKISERDDGHPDQKKQYQQCGHQRGLAAFRRVSCPPVTPPPVTPPRRRSPRVL
jgi:hypothetical protein